MAVEQAAYTAGTKVFTWDAAALGDSDSIVEIWADNPGDDTEMAFKKKALNDGEGTLSFPEGYQGTCNVEVRNASGAVESGTLIVGDENLSDE